MSGSLRVLPLNACSTAATSHLYEQATITCKDSFYFPLSSSSLTGTSSLSQSSASSPVDGSSTSSTIKMRPIYARSSSNNSSNTSSKQRKYKEYEVDLEKPIGLKFYKGLDGGVYIDAIAPGGNADKTKQFTPGDKVIFTRIFYI